MDGGIIDAAAALTPSLETIIEEEKHHSNGPFFRSGSLEEGGRRKDGRCIMAFPDASPTDRPIRAQRLDFAFNTHKSQLVAFLLPCPFP